MGFTQSNVLGPDLAMGISANVPDGGLKRSRHKARQQGLGTEIPTDWFLQDIRD